MAESQNPFEAPESQDSFEGPEGEEPAVRCRACSLCKHEVPISVMVPLYRVLICERCSFFLTTRRQLAYFIDCLILFTATALVHKIASKILIAGGSPLNKSNDLSAHLPALLFCSIAFYLRDGFRGQSIGKYLLDLIVIDDKTGRPIGWKQSLLRHWPFVLNWIVGISQLFANRDWSLADSREQVFFTYLCLSAFVTLLVGMETGFSYSLGGWFARTKVVRKSMRDHVAFRVDN